LDKILIYVGILLVIIGLLWSQVPGLFSWFGNLPGDIKHQSENTKVFIPITSMIIVSVVLSLLFRLFGD
jgi:hypothetical protein